MDGYGEIRDKFGARDKEEEGDNSVIYVSSMEENQCKTTTNPMKLFSIQTNPNIQPTVVSPLKLLQLSTISKEKALPATSAVKSISAVPIAYQSTWRITIWLRIFKGGSSEMAPARGGLLRRAMCMDKVVGYAHLLP